MKKVFLILFASILVLTGSVYDGQAQQKIGHINSNELLMLMPERDSALAQLEEKRQEFLRQSEELTVEFNNQYEDFLRQRDSLSELIRQTKESVLRDLDQKIQAFNNAADQELQTFQQELFQPIIEKAQNAIKEVAQEEGFTYVLDTGTGAVVYFPEDSLNLLESVKKKLGIQ